MLYRGYIGGGANWSHEEAVAACEKKRLLLQCVGFTELVDENGMRNVTLHHSTRIMSTDEGYMHLPAGVTAASYLKAAAAGDDGVACLQSAPASVLSSLGDFLPRGDTFETDGYAPVVDGVALQKGIQELIVAGRTPPGIDVLAGSNQDEGTIFMQLTPTLGCGATNASLRAWAADFYGPTVGAQVPGLYSRLREPVPTCRDWPTPWRPPPPPPPPPPPGAPPYGFYYMAAMRSAGDYAITCRVRQAARALSKSSSASSLYLYFFTHTPKYSANYERTSELGAFHGAEVPFVFGDAFELKTAAEKNLSAAMGCYWRNFVHTGDPNAPPDGGPPCEGGELSEWPRWLPANDMTQVMGTDKVAPEEGLKAEACALFEASTTWRPRV